MNRVLPRNAPSPQRRRAASVVRTLRTVRTPSLTTYERNRAIRANARHVARNPYAP